MHSTRTEPSRHNPLLSARPRRIPRPSTDPQRLNPTRRPRCRRPPHRPLGSCPCVPSFRVGNPNYRTGCHSKRRLRIEAQLARAWHNRDYLVTALRRCAANGHPELTAIADQLALVSLEALGVRVITHPARGGSRRQLPYYVPDVALELVTAFLQLSHAGRLHVRRVEQLALREALWARATLVRALDRERRSAYRTAAPHPSSRKTGDTSSCLSSSSEGPAPNYFEEKYGRDGGGGSRQGAEDPGPANREVAGNR